eukprot:gene165-220_t
MEDIHHILKQYWGYDHFRPTQLEIIQAVLAGKDVLALLPTGGGKSICFQVPALSKPGICLVVTPLIALMQNQVEQLRRRHIAAAAIYTGMPYAAIDLILDNCIYGTIKFLYISPERLKTPLFLERVQKMSVNLLAVDEAHCISQWGYDFRPSYLEIAALRSYLPHVNVIALTATAPRTVRQDIQEKLAFHQAIVFQQSFLRPNLAYLVKKTDHKEAHLLKLLHHIPGTAIVYVSTRRQAKSVAQWLSNNKIASTFYHAGVAHLEREQRQESWISNRVRVMVATNAFGMGIDKSDVRLVVHLNLPTTLEAYYQEAGRAGRDEKKAYAILLYDQQDITTLREQISHEHPTVEELKKVYQQLANYFQLAIGVQPQEAHSFDWDDFSKTYQVLPHRTYQAIKKLENEGLIQLNEAFFQPTQLYIPMKPRDLYAFQVAHAAYDGIIKAILRLYGGELFSDFCKISEKKLAQHLQVSLDAIKQQLRQLHAQGIVHYLPATDRPQIIFKQPRQPAHQIPLDTQSLRQKRESAQQKAEAVIHYITHTHRCRSQLLLAYLDEVSQEACHHCDICLKKPLTSSEFYEIRTVILQQIQDNPCTLQQLVEKLVLPEDKLIAVIRQITDQGEIIFDPITQLLTSPISTKF